jgi:hypothetical protein
LSLEWEQWGQGKMSCSPAGNGSKNSKSGPHLLVLYWTARGIHMVKGGWDGC